MAKEKTRRDWKKDFSLNTGDAIHKLAVYATQAGKEDLRVQLCNGNFVKTLDKLLEDEQTAPLDDLTDSERAFCEGWAYLANELYGNDAALIKAAIDAHLTRWTMTG